jgi:hypothetical protein
MWTWIRLSQGRLQGLFYFANVITKQGFHKRFKFSEAQNMPEALFKNRLGAGRGVRPYGQFCVHVVAAPQGDAPVFPAVYCRV